MTQTRMKLALTLLACLVGLSYQQSLLLSYPFTPRINYYPFYYGQHFPSAYIYEAQDENNQVVDNPAEARAKPLRPQQKFLFANPFNQFGGFGGFGGYNQLVLTLTTTQTWWMTTKGTATTASLQYCIPNSAFSTSNFGGTSVVLTAPCARRRREVDLLDQFLDKIDPTEAHQVETSAVPKVPQERHSADEPVLVSSKDDELEGSSEPLRRTGRAGTLYYTLTITVTSTYTSYSFAKTTLKKTITVGTSLLCLPSGLTIC